MGFDFKTRATSTHGPATGLQSVVDGLLERFAWNDTSRRPLPLPQQPAPTPDLQRLDPDQRVRAIGEW